MTADIKAVSIGFEETSLSIPISAIMPLRVVTDRTKASSKFAQIRASIAEVGIIEAPVVARSKSGDGTFTLLDGHLRIEVLKEQNVEQVICLVAHEDEAYTYNKRVNRIAVVQEHKMILNAVKKGVPEERLARALNVNIASIRKKRRLLTGICPEAVELVADKQVPASIFPELRNLKPVRQIEAVQLMIAMNNFSINYVRSIVAATPADQLVKPTVNNRHGLTEQQVAVMQQESAKVEREFRAIEQTYSADHLDLTFAIGYVGRILENARIVRFLADRYPEILGQFQQAVFQK